MALNTSNSHNLKTAGIEGVKNVSLQDVIGKALPRIGAYNDLDNTRHVVALINDVST